MAGSGDVGLKRKAEFLYARGQQQSSLAAALQSLPSHHLIPKFHNPFPGGTTAIVRHYDGSLDWTELGKGLQRDDISVSAVRSGYFIENPFWEIRSLHLLQQFIGHRRQQIADGERRTVSREADLQLTII